MTELVDSWIEACGRAETKPIRPAERTATLIVR
jgi:hypothetical protein